ncbi:hypothetical protein SB49_10840 [Sediminicola sp. YIK13]|uniref:hypothetical protein n=1 Tax=Sediminicola sp. YIK13 TaxID=1453352 RepID=UPI00072179A5|nr:hypothetical protein [Sediminicola sp. YIK13]ALM08242.1 hypothetical protein SB49_10840 [Sediminicola sp. YIK13]
MQNIENLISKIIPPDSREEREGFTNDEIISALTSEEHKAVEIRLIQMLDKKADLLIGQTLVKMESVNSLSTLLKRLELKNSPFERIIWAGLINNLKMGDPEMEKIAFEEFEKLEFIYAIQGGIFLDLIKFDSPRINCRIELFVNHKYDLVAHHAKMVLNHNGYADAFNEKAVHNRWWELWK